jgi:hypothetical protein
MWSGDYSTVIVACRGVTLLAEPAYREVVMTTADRMDDRSGGIAACRRAQARLDAAPDLVSCSSGTSPGHSMAAREPLDPL